MSAASAFALAIHLGFRPSRGISNKIPSLSIEMRGGERAKRSKKLCALVSIEFQESPAVNFSFFARKNVHQPSREAKRDR
jgi:hypothetical protein